MDKKVFGSLPSGENVHIYTLDNGILRATVLDYGCRIQSLIYDGRDMVCGFDSLEAYLADDSSQGAFVGRVANRIRGARFTLNGKEYRLTPNEKENHLHGSFALSLWKGEQIDACTLKLTRKSPASEEGYPGDMEITVLYQLEGNAIKMRYYSTADADTPANFTNHAYFNLNGVGGGSILGHEMQINADKITLVDGDLLPTGEHMTVDGTPYDFHAFHTVGERLSSEVDGYDTNFWLTQDEPISFDDKTLFRALTLRSASYAVDCYTDMPCIQIYSGNFLGSGPDFKYGVKQAKQHGICLETQYEPDCVNRGEGILRKGETYDSMTVYRFTHR